MNKLTILENAKQVMTSREIAELMEKEHKHVLRDIKELLESYAINQSNFKLVEYVAGNGQKQPMYELDFEATMTLITGYDAKRRAIVIKRWKELETGEAFPAYQMKREFQPLLSTPKEVAIRELKAETDLLLSVFKVPEHIALIEAVKQTRKDTGFDFSYALINSPIQNNILDDEIMLEPTDLGKHFNLSGKDMNRKLRDLNLQYKTDSGWKPTDEGIKISSKHSWSVGGKSGYNLKWNLRKIKKLIYFEK